MDAAINTIISEFKNYAGADGSSSTLSKSEFENLVVSQLSNLVPNADGSVIEELMSNEDENNDGQLTFPEFWKVIGSLASKRGGFS